jgi:hypothetical protein
MTKQATTKDLIILRDVHPDIRKVFWSFSDKDPGGFKEKLNSLGAAATYISSHWTNEFDRDSIKKQCEMVSKQYAFIGPYVHALGILEYFRVHPLFIYAGCVEEATKKVFPNTVFSQARTIMKNASFCLEYQNTYLLESLLNSLVAFKQETKEESELLTLCIQQMHESIKIQQENRKTTDIFQELAKDKATYTFSTGRSSPSLHATNITLNDKYIAFADRYDVHPHYFTPPKNIPQSVDVKQTTYFSGRNNNSGVYIYKMRKSLSSLTQKEQGKLMNYLTRSISREESLLGIKALLGLPKKADYEIVAKMQTKGNCRYASKKQAVSSLIAINMLMQQNENKAEFSSAEIFKNIYLLQKDFKCFDRLYKIDQLINNSELPHDQKIQLLILTLLRNCNFLMLNDLDIFEKITSYFETLMHHPDFMTQLTAVFQELLISLPPTIYAQQVIPILARLAEYGIPLTIEPPLLAFQHQFPEKEALLYLQLTKEQQAKSVEVLVASTASASTHDGIIKPSR